MRRRFVALLGLALSAATLPAASRALPVSFAGLGDLPGGLFGSDAAGVSADGSVVVGTSSSSAFHPAFSEVFRWTLGGGMVGLGSSGQATAVSADGSVVVGTSEGEAFRWTSAEGIVFLGSLPGVSSSSANGVSADGSVVVGGSGPEAFRWTSGGGMVGLGALPGRAFSGAKGVSADGSVVVGSGDSASVISEAFRWTSGGGMVGLGSFCGNPNPGCFSEAHGVSADGSTVVGAANGLLGGAFRWTSSTGMTNLGVIPGGDFSIANSVSGDGTVVVGVGSSPSFPSGTSPGGEAFVWDAVHGMRSVRQVLIDAGVDLTAWTLESATGVSADGRTIVGNGTNPLGQPEAWIATIPEPGTALLLLTGLLALAARAKRLV